MENTPVAGRNGEEEEDGEEKAVEGGRAMDAAGGKVSPRPPQACAHAARPASRSQAPPQPSLPISGRHSAPIGRWQWSLWECRPV